MTLERERAESIRLVLSGHARLAVETAVSHTCPIIPDRVGKRKIDTTNAVVAIHF